MVNPLQLFLVLTADPTLSQAEMVSGEPSRISWASARFCENVNVELIKTFCGQPAQKRYEYLNYKFYSCNEVLVIITDLAISLATFG